jgi:hypothetical protein
MFNFQTLKAFSDFKSENLAENEQTDKYSIYTVL